MAPLLTVAALFLAATSVSAFAPSGSVVSRVARCVKLLSAYVHDFEAFASHISFHYFSLSQLPDPVPPASQAQSSMMPPKNGQPSIPTLLHGGGVHLSRPRYGMVDTPCLVGLSCVPVRMPRDMD